MPVYVTHPKVSGLSDTGDSSLIQPSDWNAEHEVVGLGEAAELDVGTVPGTVAPGNHTHTELEYLHLPNVTEVPNLEANGGVLYMEAGSLKLLGPTGVVTVLVAAPL